MLRNRCEERSRPGVRRPWPVRRAVRPSSRWSGRPESNPRFCSRRRARALRACPSGYTEPRAASWIASAARRRASRPTGSISASASRSRRASGFAGCSIAPVFADLGGRCSNPAGQSCILSVGHACRVPDVVSQLLTTEVALDKLGARGISAAETEQAIWNRHVVVRNRRGRPERRQREARRLLIGRSDAGRLLTLVIEETTWLLVTGWESTPAERMILERS